MPQLAQVSEWKDSWLHKAEGPGRSAPKLQLGSDLAALHAEDIEPVIVSCCTSRIHRPAPIGNEFSKQSMCQGTESTVQRIAGLQDSQQASGYC